MLKFVFSSGWHSPLPLCVSLTIFSHVPGYRAINRPLASPAFNCRGERGPPAELGAEALKAPVIIVGAGPVGLSLSILLSKYGIRSMVVERKAQLPQHPQAHFLNNRTMEIFRKMDGLADEIQRGQPPLEEWGKFVYCNSLTGLVLGTVDHLQPNETLQRRSPTTIGHYSQHRLLPLLLSRAQKLCLPVYHGNNIQSDGQELEGILLGHKLVSLEANPNGVVGRISASDITKDFECSYLVAADGAGSFVRRWMGVGMQGEAEMQKLISVHFLSKELGHHLLTNQPGMLYFVFNAQVIAVIVAHNLQLGEFVAQIPYYPPQKQFEDFTEEVCKELIQGAAGIANLAMEIKSVRSWVMDAQVADNFVCGHSRVILAGDAAHRFPPAGGFGMNTGIQDVHNLAWKLAAVLNKHMPPDFVYTYEDERRPIAKANTDLSVANFKAAMAIPEALGLYPSAARQQLTAGRDKWPLQDSRTKWCTISLNGPGNRMAQKMVTSGASWLPDSVQSAILDGFFRMGRLQVSPSVLNTFNPFGSARIARVQQILQQGHSLQLQFPAEDLGFRYSSGAIVPEMPQMGQVEYSKAGEKREYWPSTRPGARLPHCSISYLGQDYHVSGKALFSTLDLVSADRLGFLLIIGPGRNGCLWGHAALQAAKICRIPVRIAIIWPEGSADRLWMSFRCEMDHPPLTEEESYVVYQWGHENRDHVVQVEESGDSWWELCGVPAVGAILVRPDDHVAWRATWQADDGAASELERVLRRLQGK